MKKWSISILLLVLLAASMLLITGCPRVQNKVPTVNKVSGPSGTITQSSTTFSWTGNDSDGTIAKYEYRKDEGSWVSNGTSTSYTWSDYSKGNHKFEVRAQDNEGAYSSTISWAFTYDRPNQAPTITKVSGPSGTISQSSSTFSWTGSDSDGTIDSYEYRKDFGNWVSNGTNTSYVWNGYSEGPHTFEVRARDNKGAYSTPVQWTFAFIFADFSWQELRNAAYYSGGLLSCSSEENQIEEGMFVKMLTSSGKYGYINIISNEDEIVFDLLIYQNEVQSIFTENVSLTVGNSMDLDSDGRDDILWEELDRTGNLAMTSFRVNQFQGMRYLEFIYNHESSIGTLFSYEVVTSSGIINFNPTDGSIVASSENYELYEGEGATEEQVAFGLTETLPAFQAGDIIVDHKTKWLRKVVSSPEYYSDHVVIQTEEASLDEAFPDLKIDFSGRLSELEQVFNMQEEEFEGIYCQEEVTLVKNEDALVKLLFYMGFNPEIVISKNEDESLPNKIGFSGELKASVELLANFATEYKASGETPKFFILTVPFAIGPVPIEIVVNMYAGYEFEASANGQANLGSEFTMVTEFGVENRGGWGLYENTQTKMEMTEPEYSIEGSVRFKPYVKVEFGMIVAFVFGVHTGISPYLEAEGNASMTSEEELQVNMGLDLGIEGDLYLKLGRGIVSSIIPGGDPWKLFDLRYTIWEASFGWPAMPRNLSIADVTSESLRLNWEDRSDIESGYELWRKTTGDFSLVADLVPNKETYTDTNLTEGAKYTYKLRAYSSFPGDIFRIHSAWSNEIVGTPSENSPPLVTKVSGFEGVINQSSNSFTWTGSDPDGTITKYEYRKDGGTWTSNGTSKSYTWSDYSVGTHTFEVRAQDNDEQYSDAVSWSFTYSTGTVVVGEMVLVEGGAFMMGDEFGDLSGNCRPVHEVMFTYDFEIGKYELTFDEYDTFCDDTGRSKPSDMGWGRGIRPVIYVTWWDAIAYCNWLSTRNGLPIAYRLKGEVNEGQLLDSNGNVTTDLTEVVGYRLPTEAEWEYAARGGKYNSPYKYSGSDNVSDVAWYSDNSVNKTHEVGQKLPNALGIYDMSGNVFEMCSDLLDVYYSYPQTNPYIAIGRFRTLRGGFWELDPKQVRVAERSGLIPDDAWHCIGLRICRTIKVSNRIPTVTKVSGPSYTVSKISTFTWTGSDPDGTITKYEYRKDGGTWTSNGTSKSYTWSGYSEGNHEFEVRAQDNKGAYSSIIYWYFTYQKENEPPTVTKVSGPSEVVSESSSTFTWTGSDSDGTITKYEYRKDEGSWVSNGTSTSYTWSDYLKGDHKFEVRAQDNEGDYSNIISWSFTYSTGAVVVGEMVLVEGGTFMMGDTWGDGYSDELPVHQVTLTYDFYIGKYETTFDEYDAFCEATGKSSPDDENWGRGNRPVINVSWNDAIAYCNWLSDKEKLPKAYDSNGNLLDKNGSITTDPSKVVGYRLPTEAEWEYAARGGKYNSPYKYSGSDNVNDVAWYSSNSGNMTHEVGLKLPNALGIHDMSGNVAEWCSDWYEDYSSSAQTNPYNSTAGSARVYRGGSCYSVAAGTRVAYRNLFSPAGTSGGLGFRIARTVP